MHCSVTVPGSHYSEKCLALPDRPTFCQISEKQEVAKDWWRGQWTPLSAQPRSVLGSFGRAQSRLSPCAAYPSRSRFRASSTTQLVQRRAWLPAWLNHYLPVGQQGEGGRVCFISHALTNQRQPPIRGAVAQNHVACLNQTFPPSLGLDLDLFVNEKGVFDATGTRYWWCLCYITVLCIISGAIMLQREAMG